MTSSSLELEGRAFAERIFDTVRQLSVDTLGVTRQGYGPKETAVIDFLRSLGKELSLEERIDAAGNVWLTLAGKDRSLPAFVAGSHADSVPQGGNFDGLAGVAAAMLCAWWMRHTNFQPERDFSVLILRCEESSFFGKAYVGSLGMMGKLTAADLELKHRTEPVTLGEAIAACGLDPKQLTMGRPVIDTSKIAAFVELHIEQGPVLTSSADVRTGIVTGIRGNIRHKCVKAIGETAHSGAVDKAYRHDALMAAACLMHTMEAHWQRFLDAGEDLVFTSGVFKTAPTAAISVIPGLVTFTIDMRSLSMDTCERFHALLVSEAERIGAERGVRFEFDAMLRTQPAALNQMLSERIAHAAKLCGIPVAHLASGAGHDSAVLGNAGIPTAMIFIANQNGSHNPDEAMELADFMRGTELLWRTVENYDK